MRYGVCRCNATIARLGLSTLGCEIDRWLTRTARTSEEAVIAPAMPDNARPVKDPSLDRSVVVHPPATP